MKHKKQYFPQVIMRLVHATSVHHSYKINSTRPSMITIQFMN